MLFHNYYHGGKEVLSVSKQEKTSSYSLSVLFCQPERICYLLDLLVHYDGKKAYNFHMQLHRNDVQELANHK
jgi:hypothetical protein